MSSMQAEDAHDLKLHIKNLALVGSNMKEWETITSHEHVDGIVEMKDNDCLKSVGEWRSKHSRTMAKTLIVIEK